MNKNNNQKGFIIPLIIAIVVVLLAGGAYLAYKNEKGQVGQVQQTNDQFLASTTTGAVMSSTTTIDNVHTNATGGSNTNTALQTYTNSQYGLSLQYPTTLGDATISTPQVFVISTKTNIDTNGCYQSGLGGSGTDSHIVENNIQFCQSNDLDPGAGTLSGDYYFTTLKNGEYITIGYPTFTTNGCSKFAGGPNYQSCENFENNYNSIVIQPLQQSAGSLKFISSSTTSTSQPSITVISPNGGETYKIGDILNITWTSKNLNIPGISIGLFSKDFNTQNVVTGSKNQNSYSWKIPSGIIPGNYKVIVSTSYGSATSSFTDDQSDNYFTITN